MGTTTVIADLISYVQPKNNSFHLNSNSIQFHLRILYESKIGINGTGRYNLLLIDIKRETTTMSGAD